MKMQLSPFLQSKPNLFIYRFFGWKFAQLYIFLLGNIFFYLNKKEKLLISGAVNTVFKDNRDKKNIGQKVIKGLFAHYYEKLFIAFEDKAKTKEFMDSHLISKDVEILQARLKKGKGVLLVTAHYGAIEYIPALLAVKGLPTVMIAKFKTEHLKKKVITKAKQEYDVEMIDALGERSVLKTAVQYLRQNLVLVTQCDEIEEWRPSTGRNICFLGKNTGLDRTIDIIHRRTGTEIVFGVIHRFSLNRYHLKIYPLDQMLVRLGFKEGGISAGEAVIRFLELLILNNPEQWYVWNKYYDIKNFHIAHSHIEASCSCRKRVPPMRFLNSETER